MRYYCEIVPFELAKKLKEAGYREECSGHYAKNGYLWETCPKQNSNDTENFFSAPTYADVFDWLIEQGYFVFITPSIIDPDDYKVGDTINEWDGWMNADKYARRASFHEAAPTPQ